jgi:hypothetical protein
LESAFIEQIFRIPCQRLAVKAADTPGSRILWTCFLVSNPLLWLGNRHFWQQLYQAEA